MNKKLKWLCLTPMILAVSSGLTSCGSDSDYLILRVINSEDYIYLQEDPSDPEDLVVQFEKSEAVANYLDELRTNKGLDYKGVKVIYDTSDTNETLYSELQTGKSNYDLMNVSDYMAQKIVSQKMAVPLYRNEDGTVNYDMVSNYQSYASASLKQRLDDISTVQKTFNTETNHLDEVEVYLKDYAVGYMWGTLGILFNPEYPSFQASGYTRDEVIADMQTFDTFWNSKYKGTISIKNSMRDTYAVGVLYTYREDFARIKGFFEDGQDDQGNPYTIDDYSRDFETFFNRCSSEEVNQVKASLEALKGNIFGLEVDSGKQDIITKKIGVNLAWSGDAVYSMDQGEDLTQVSETVELCYSVPENGSNLWMDTWIMPNCTRSREQYELAHLFLNFMSDPVNAVQNMSYTGYTSFIGGDSILDLVREWYDSRYEEVYYGDDGLQVYYADSATEVYQAVDFSTDFFAARDASKDDYLLYVFEPYEDGENLVEEPASYNDLISHSMEVPLLDEEGEETETQKKYGDLLIVDEAGNEYDSVDLGYFFTGTLEEYDVSDAVFYCEEYFLAIEDEEGNPIDNVSVGRQFFCQYPNEETLNHCAVMKDYGENNTYVMNMWENFKSDPLPTWAIITFAVAGAGVIAFVAYLVINNVLKKQTKKKRIQNS